MKNTKINPKERKKPNDFGAATDLVKFPPSRTDPEGWYTGRPINEWAKPVQDADDL